MKITFVFLLLLFSSSVFAQEIEIKNYSAKKVDDLNINIDGSLNETEWQTANWENQFIQYEPNEGKEPFQQTEFAILYDENNIYVAIKSIDKSPDSISMRLTRRDVTDGDMVGIMLDTYRDKRTGFNFIVSAAGIKSDFIMSNDGANEDLTWDPIWWVKTTKTNEGWNAEMRIPLTQLRFEEGQEQLWGMQVVRYIFRKDELSTWQAMKREKAGFVSQFGTISGIKDIKPKNSLNITPYAVARTERFEKEPDNPFRNSGKSNDLDIGLDAKIGLTNFLTLDLTINPDFGQVEADPSEVNLSTYETFFEEKRPFFIEGKNILNYSLQFGDGDLAAEGLFYSRRIGRRPHYYPDLNNGEFTEVPDFTRILGAAKITGKTSNGWSIGILESVTGEENAQIKGIGDGRTQSVEPLTNYFVGRVQKDFNEGNTYLGGMFTSVNRSINDSHLDFLHKSAYTGGLDFVHKWDDRNWLVDAGLYFSQVNGSKDAITRTQESYIRIFQRPDADYVQFDENRTSLSGHGGKLTVGKVGGKFNFGHIMSWKSPGLELNDIGFAQQVDRILQVLWSNYNFYEPFSIFRKAGINASQHSVWDFGGNRTALGGNLSGNAQFTNFWTTFAGLSLSGEQRFNSGLRGGPALLVPGYKYMRLGIFSNQQKKLTMTLMGGQYFSNEQGFRSISDYNISFGYRPIKSLRIDLSPGINTYSDDLQYVTQTDYQGGTRYVMAQIDRTTVNMSVRINFNISPDLTIQYWGQPFVATGKYSEFKHITDSKADELSNRFNIYSDEQISYNSDWEAFLVDDNRDGVDDYSFSKPDFNVKEFLSNLVVRWEYRPGSTVYLVWSQNRSGYINNGSFDFSRDFESLFNEKANNIFLLKFSYRIGR
ncbi:MAG: carbohydrate binding family 9 domain-containing protein [Prolixibacteraceae bacterium]|jgi:hypothetical protein|nr:carbohydrate binding family 9 domain-containing protein [Prolixibacteraceae bacterium]MBT6997582.1 carbohydrate binding family 9 domain-containing protein [Prolixibacteraceae bacterium]MBT7395067.1 carbohydrate binding family 9 domain-containing protein [Prolixibacteraceae bacterium]